MLNPLLQCLPEVDEKIQSASRVALFLDFDGTLAPIQADPANAQLSQEARDVLRRIAQQDFVFTTVISGRAVEDLYTRIRLDGIVYAGNHGLEIFGRGLRFVEPAADARRDQMQRLSEALADDLQAVPGVIVEDKGLSASIHYRGAAEADVPAIEDAVRYAVAAAGAWFRTQPGSKSIEIVPRTGWHKGAAVQWINRHLGENGLLPIYLGDDYSDEDAFAVLGDGVTVKVNGAIATCARYRVPDPDAVYQFLLWLESRVAARSPVA
jgi:trehalose 6-phosphate phosphatase